MKEDKYTKRLAKYQVYAIVHMRDIGKNVLPKFIKLCMETPCLCPFQGHKYGRRKPIETSVFEFSYLCVNSSLEELIKIKVKTKNPLEPKICLYKGFKLLLYHMKVEIQKKR